LADSLTASCACFLGANEEHRVALAHNAGEKFARGIELLRGLAEVDDVNPVTRVEDELLHLGIPAAGLMSEMDARFQ
jgi:hypothetical protein